MSSYIPRYEGYRWTIVYGKYEGIEAFALEELQRLFQSFLPYVIKVIPSHDFNTLSQNDHLVFLGTPKSNPHLSALLHQARIKLDDSPEGFYLGNHPSPWNDKTHCVIITGNSSQGILWGVEAFNSWILANQALPDKSLPAKMRNGVDLLPNFQIQERPFIAERGLWTWGYVIYDFRRFLDAMARLRMNCLTIWNDIPPINCHKLIDYAHERGIKIILGFNWGWGMDYSLADPSDRLRIQRQVLQHYQESIAPLVPDGIYFQTLTEHNQLQLGDRSIASLTCELVNQTAAELFRLTPYLDIRFGLHASSIRDRYQELVDLDPRITIVWEDAGALPFSYLPELSQNGISHEETLSYACKLAAFRPSSLFAIVAKGWTTLDWQDEFEHHEQYLIGERSRHYVHNRLEQIKPRWAKVNRLWLQHYPKAQEFYQSVSEAAQGKMSVLGLVEDGLIEETIQPSVSLFAETLWNPFADPGTLLSRALSSYFDDAV